MSGESQQENMSMEDILSSIKDILNNEGGEINSAEEQEQSSLKQEEQEQTSEDSLSKALVKEDEQEDDDVYDLSKSMIIDETQPEDMDADKFFEEELDETGPLFDEFSNQDDISLEDDISIEDDINLSDIPEDVDFSMDIPEDNDITALMEENLAEENSEKQEVDKAEDIMLEEPVSSSEIMPSEDMVSPDVVLQAAQDVLTEDKYQYANTSNKTEAEKIFEDHEGIQEVQEAQEISMIPADEQIKEPETIIKQENITKEEIKEPEIIVKQEEKAVEETKAEVLSSMQTDATDVSADIINNFAKMFAEKTPPMQEEVAYEEEKIEQPKDNINLIGDGSKTIEDIVKDTIKEIVMVNVNAEMTKNVDIVSLAKEEIRSQAKVWIEQNLPTIVNAAVKEELERVMAKVGK